MGSIVLSDALLAELAGLYRTADEVSAELSRIATEVATTSLKEELGRLMEHLEKYHDAVLLHGDEVHYDVGRDGNGDEVTRALVAILVKLGYAVTCGRSTKLNHLAVSKLVERPHPHAHTAPPA